jgi:hypothetical protein
MMVERLPNGNLLVPRRAEADDGTIGDAWFEIGPEHPDYQRQLEDVLRQERILGAKSARPPKRRG